jgi:vitamin B12 transporter
MRRELLAGAAALLLALPAGAQRPGEIAGRVAEAGGGAPVEMAAVEVLELGVRAWTDAAGRFRFTTVEPGRWRVRVARAGYSTGHAEVVVRAGEAARVEVPLTPEVLALEAVRVRADRSAGLTLDRRDIERRGAATVAELLDGAPGLVVRPGGAGGPRTVSLRGSSAGQVLVLVDGVPLNDPVSGEADLSSVPAASVEEVVVLPGARSVRWGGGATAGVVLIRTRGPAPGGGASASAGTLGERALDGEWGTLAPGAALQGGIRLRSLTGAFTHPRDENDPRPVRRENADLREGSAFVAASGRAPGGDLRLRASAESVERGLPGTGHTPSRHARQALERGRASAGWRRSGAGGSLVAHLSAAAHRVRHHDPVPPLAVPYDDTTRAVQVVLRLERDHPSRGPVQAWGWGAEASVQRIASTALSADAPRLRREAGVFAHAAAGTGTAGREVTLSLEARVDRDAGSGRPIASHAATAGTWAGGIRVHLSHRSGYAPPALGDQFFRGPVGVEADPALRAQRVPGEWELAAGWSGAGATGLAVDLAAYRGRVDGMIAWLPDHRFLWRPRNVDALRSGGEARVELRIRPAGVRLHGDGALARVTWADPAARGVQLPYRPRHTGGVGLELERGPWRLDTSARYTGARSPAAAPVNVLPGFWSTSARLARSWPAGAWTLRTAIDGDRLLDERGALIAGFPEPGRRLRIDVRVERTRPSTPIP